MSFFRCANVLLEAHVHALSPEEAIRAQLQLKEHANEAQRHFLRYVFHEAILVDR